MLTAKEILMVTIEEHASHLTVDELREAITSREREIGELYQRLENVGINLDDIDELRNDLRRRPAEIFTVDKILLRKRDLPVLERELSRREKRP